MTKEEKNKAENFLDAYLGGNRNVSTLTWNHWVECLHDYGNKLRSENERLKAEIGTNGGRKTLDEIKDDVSAYPDSANVDLDTYINRVALLYASQSKQSEMGWISVEDELPEYKQQVLVYTKLKSTIRGIYHNRKWDIDFRIVDMSYVTHWMPLPQPPKQ